MRDVGPLFHWLIAVLLEDDAVARPLVVWQRTPDDDCTFPVTLVASILQTQALESIKVYSVLEETLTFLKYT
jgi:hypothetical protein